MSHKHESDTQRRNRQLRERQERVEVRNVHRIVQERLQKIKRRQSWIKPWLHACRHIRAYPIHEREAIFHNFIPLHKLPRSLAGSSSSKSGKRVARSVESWNSLTVEGTPLGVFSTPTESSKSAVG